MTGISMKEDENNNPITPEQEKESYSCTRCRKYKKKCSRDKPACQQCAKNKIECFYPGRAKRRTLKAIQLERDLSQSGEVQSNFGEEKVPTDSELVKLPDSLLESAKIVSSSKKITKNTKNQKLKNSQDSKTATVKRKYSKKTPDTLPSISNVSTFSPSLSSLSPTPSIPNINTLLNPTVSDLKSQNGILPFISQNNIGPGPPFTPETFEYLSSIVNFKNGVNSGKNNISRGLSPGALSTSNTSLSNVFSSTSPNENMNIDKTTPSNINKYSSSHKDEENGFGKMPLCSITTQPNIPFFPHMHPCPTDVSTDNHFCNTTSSSQKAQKSCNQVQGLMEHELHKPPSIPIKASSIQIENISAVFKGGRNTNWPLGDDFSNSFLKIDHSLYLNFIDAYFQHNHRSYPMINKFEFHEKISKIKDFNNLDMSNDYDPVFLFMLYMIMAIGCTSLSRAGVLKDHEKELSEHFAYIGMKRFCAIMHLQNLDTIRCLILLGIYSFFEPKGVSSWTIGGIISRITIGLGLNREVTNSRKNTMNKLELEFRHRIFWSAYVFERLVHSSLGRISFLDDDDIDVPLPVPICPEEYKDIQVTEMIISIRRMGGRIYNKVHSVKATRVNANKTAAQKQLVVDNLGLELDQLFEAQRVKMKKIQSISSSSTPMSISESSSDISHSGESNAKKDISFHNSELWLVMRYEQLQIMLYRPSKLLPTLPTSTLTILGQVCLTALKHTHMLFEKNMLPYNWITLFRTLTICNTLLFCLCQWCIDTKDCQIEIEQCVEILKHFGAKWVFAINCAKVFENITSSITEFSLGSSSKENLKHLNQELFGASNEYQDILDENNVDISWLDDLWVK